MARVYNFSAGPATLPEEVLQEAAAEMMDYQGCGMSVMEISHRTPIFDKIIGEAEQDLPVFHADSARDHFDSGIFVRVHVVIDSFRGKVEG